MGIFRLIAATLFIVILAASASALACTPAPGWSPEKERAEEDQALLGADVFYRGVFERIDTSDRVNDHGGADLDRLIVTIRQTRTLWGGTAPRTLVVPWVYLVICPLPNLMDAYWDAVDGPHALLKRGWGVTVIGRREDFANRQDRVFILVDGQADTSRIVARFQQLRLGWRTDRHVEIR